MFAANGYRVKSRPLLYHSMTAQTGELNVRLQGGAVYTVVVTQAFESSSTNVTVSYRKTGPSLSMGSIYRASFPDFVL